MSLRVKRCLSLIIIIIIIIIILLAVGDAIRTSLGPRGMDKMVTY